jgi:hypothetical protein
VPSSSIAVLEELAAFWPAGATMGLLGIERGRLPGAGIVPVT